MSPTSAGGGMNTKTGGEHISRLVETPIGSFAYGKTSYWRYKSSLQYMNQVNQLWYKINRN